MNWPMCKKENFLISLTEVCRGCNPQPFLNKARGIQYTILIFSDFHQKRVGHLFSQKNQGDRSFLDFFTDIFVSFS